MLSAQSAQPAQDLHHRRDAIADHWYRAVASTSFAPLGSVQVRQRLNDLTEQVIALLLAERFDRDAARSIGAALASFHYLEPQALAGTQEALAQQLVEGLPADQIAALYPRLTALLAELAAGFTAQARDIVLAEQEQIRQALVAERRQAQEALRESEARYRAVSELTSDFAYTHRVEPDGTLVTDWVPPAYSRITGFAVGEESVNSWRSIMHPDDLPVALQLLQSNLANQAGVAEYRIFAKDGATRWLRVHGRPVWDEAQGRVVRIYGAAQDITERKRAEEAQQERLKELGCLFGISALLELQGISLDEILQRIVMLIPPAWRFPEITAACIVLEGQTIQTAHFRETPWMMAFGIIVNGKPVGQVKVCYLEDRQASDDGPFMIEERHLLKAIAERLGHIIEHKWAEESLRESEERLKLVLEGSRQGLWDWNIETGEVRRNERWAEMLGYTLAETEFTVEQWTDLVHPDDRAAARQSTQDHLEGRTPMHEIEYRMLTKDGQYRWILDRARIVKRDPRGRPLRMSGTHTDITEQRQMRDLLVRHAQEMEALYETSLEINSQPDIPVLLETIVQRAANLVGTQMGGLYLIKPDGQTLELVVCHNLPDDYLGVTLHLGEGLAGRVAQTGKPMAIEDYQHWEKRAAMYATARLRRVLGVPLKVGDTVIGVIDVTDDKTVGPFGEDEIRLVSLFADQAALAVENARLYQAEREQRELAETLCEVGATLTSTLQVDEILDRLLEHLSRVVPHDAANIMLIESNRTRAASWRGYERLGVRDLGHFIFAVDETPLFKQMLTTGEPVIVPDTHTDPLWVRTPGTTWLRSYAAAPIRLKTQIIGFLNLDSATPGFFGRQHAERLRAFADQAAIVIENARLYQAEREQRELAETLREVGTTLVSTLDTNTVLDRILEQVSRVVPNDAANIMLIQGDCAYFAGWRGYPQDTLKGCERFGIEDLTNITLPVSGTRNLQQMVETGEPVVIPDMCADPHWVHVPGTERLRSYAGVPIRVRGETIGFLAVISVTPGSFVWSDAERLRAFADQAALALENARLFEQARKTAERLQLLSRRLVEVQEAERRYIARELHDEVGQVLTGLVLLLEMSARQLGDAARDNLSEAQALTHDLLTRVREMSLDLRPAMLDDLGLLPALLWHLERFTAQTHVRVTFKHTLPEQRFAPEIETVAYRVVQEALTNVARHAGVNEASVWLWATQDMLGLQVKDRGTGFDPEAQLADGRGSGLSGMRERVALLGGQLTIESSPGAGACLTAELPLRQLSEES